MTTALTHQELEELGADFLLHYGVMGMKWGKHRAKASAADIRGARARLAVQRHDFHTAKKAAKQIKDKGQRQAALDKVGHMKTDFLKNPDRVAAARLTRGEKVAATILFGGLAPVAVTSMHSRRIEQKQDKGKYDKKK
jgi:hypothetical protein